MINGTPKDSAETKLMTAAEAVQRVIARPSRSVDDRGDGKPAKMPRVKKVAVDGEEVCPSVNTARKWSWSPRMARSWLTRKSKQAMHKFASLAAALAATGGLATSWKWLKTVR